MTILSGSPEQTEHLGELLGGLLVPGDVICLSGPLGAGKTSMVRGLVRGWGAPERATSPTFALINVYRHPSRAETFYHVDCYRMSGPADARTAGLEDILDGEDIVVIEWPERIGSLLPDDVLWVALSDQGGDRRAITFSARGERSAALVQGFEAALP
ncbi:MAG: tRNA (adenosine(37)-N6)-threonylcarbamoyltransferase complex ATPase subunit type 1 TsaE [Anaerolineae bacterium]